MQSIIQWFSTVLLLILFFGCSAKQKPIAPPIHVPEVMNKVKYEVPGSLYTGYDNPFSDAKAYNVGDIVTIVVNEKIQGAGSTNTKTARAHKMDLSFPSPTFMDKKVANKNIITAFNQSSTNSFQGKGGTNRSAKLIAKITARVTKVYPNGSMFIVGKKYVKINEDMQYLKISGIINPRDISPENTIDSSKISDMYVEYNGKGFMAQTQEPGWLANFIMKIWPF